MNKYAFIGNLTKDAEVRKAGSSTLCTFTVAVNSGWGERKHVDYVKVNIWGKKAESGLPAQLTKGRQVAGCGDVILSKREHEGKQYADMECTVQDIDLIGGKPVEQSNQSSQPAQASGDDMNDSIPF